MIELFSIQYSKEVVWPRLRVGSSFDPIFSSEYFLFGHPALLRAVTEPAANGQRAVCYTQLFVCNIDYIQA